MEPVIRFEDVWKQYRIGGSHYRSIREDVSRAGQAVVRGASRLMGLPIKPYSPRPTFWALKGLNLDIQKGERVGIIGPNGAGKTTALRLMGRITECTKGKIHVRGKVGALISVGAGIHPELTGRENIFLYGSIMGLKNREIQAKFDKIVAFAGVEQFLDTAVKYFSSGMRIRLGFSVAVHVDPDIMLVDEVLAVGDHEFQVNCLDKIEELSRNGCTIVYVSHDLYSVKQACRRVVFLNHGAVVEDGDPQHSINRYLDMAREGEAAKEGATPSGLGSREGSFEATIEKVMLLDSNDQPVETIDSGASLTVEIHYSAPTRIPTPDFGFNIKRNDGLWISVALASWEGFRLPEIHGPGVVRTTIANLDLGPGSYRVSVSLTDQTGMAIYDQHYDAYPFTVAAGTRTGAGVLWPLVRWQAGVTAANPERR